MLRENVNGMSMETKKASGDRMDCIGEAKWGWFEKCALLCKEKLSHKGLIQKWRQEGSKNSEGKTNQKSFNQKYLATAKTPVIKLSGDIIYYHPIFYKHKLRNWFSIADKHRRVVLNISSTTLNILPDKKILNNSWDMHGHFQNESDIISAVILVISL